MTPEMESSRAQGTVLERGRGGHIKLTGGYRLRGKSPQINPGLSLSCSARATEWGGEEGPLKIWP